MKFSEDDIFRAFREGYLACAEYHGKVMGSDIVSEADKAAHEYVAKLKLHAVEQKDM